MIKAKMTREAFAQAKRDTRRRLAISLSLAALCAMAAVLAALLLVAKGESALFALGDAESALRFASWALPLGSAISVAFAASCIALCLSARRTAWRWSAIAGNVEFLTEAELAEMVSAERGEAE